MLGIAAVAQPFGRDLDAAFAQIERTLVQVLDEARTRQRRLAGSLAAG